MAHSGQRMAKEIATMLYEFLLEIGVYDALKNKIKVISSFENVSGIELETASVYVQVWNIFMNLLDELVETLGNELMNFETFKN